MTSLEPWYAARNHMVNVLCDDLYGSPADEILSEPPLQRYIVGILHPRAEARDMDGPEDANETPDVEAGTAPDAAFDPGVSFARLRYPSTMGLTFGLREATTHLTITVAADRYVPEGENEQNEQDEGVVGTGPATRARRTVITSWRRVALGPISSEIDTTAPGSIRIPMADGLELRVVIREARLGSRSVTAVLVNTAVRARGAFSDHLCWFRPTMRVVASNGSFTERRPEDLHSNLDEDELSGELLYRDTRNLAVGHGVAVTWEESPEVRVLDTTFFPRHELNLADPDRLDVDRLSMDALAHMDDPDALVAPLKQLAARYEAWIDEQQVDASRDLEDHYRPIAERHLREAKVAAGRIRAGILLLESDSTARRAFRLMNAAMQLQREKQELLRNGRTDVEGTWRPFQLAFILLNLRGLVDPSSDERELADLLWFPTGGGKTEAYLGLIGFTLIHRRLRGAGDDGDGGGVGVIMRYTLRLLTLQQFERAAGLICALQALRDSDQELSARAEFSVGLWVGQGATPNNVADAARALRSLNDDQDPGEKGNPVQLLRCPWCGAALAPRDYHADKIADRLTVRCPDDSCRFSGGRGLPIHLVDSDVYRARPSLVIGTVDKFAMLAWREGAGRLFGRGSGASPDAAPDLIVQDELHLISGPLGTLVGLYETVVDHLATDPESGARPKVIASTATIRRASAQVKAVFDRETRQFPPPGLVASDSFFAVEAPRDKKGTREYVGVMAPGTSQVTLLVRTYAALLQGAESLEASEEVRDAYWTLLGYFNSLRVLGAAYIQSIDDVPDRIKVIASRTGTEPRDVRDPAELTSRIRPREVPAMLERLQKQYPDKDSPDIVLATNMISVGVDVDRLGLMVVMGQPQATAEYIQATSRVGRKFPGLVFTLYNAARSRDLSHYESFTTYHRAIYRQVEATGATPFASRALDRGLHGVLVALARHTTPGASSDDAARVPPTSGALPRVIDVIRQRAQDVAGGNAAGAVEEALQQLADIWTSSLPTHYPKWGPNAVNRLIAPAGSTQGSAGSGSSQLTDAFPPVDPPWPTLTSLRDVDRESTIFVTRPQRTRRSRGDD